MTPGAVLLENEDLLVIDKPAGRDVIPSRDPRAPACLRDEWSALRGRVWVVHRLDRDTSGVLVFAKNPAAHRRWNAAFVNRRVQKSYLAIVRGELPLVGAVVQPLREFGSGRMGVDPRGKPSDTRYAVLSAGNGARVLTVTPVTGRRHQIRAHMAFAGAPVDGDPLYGPAPRPIGGAPRLMLHAWRLSLPGEPAFPPAVEAPWPRALRDWIRVVGAEQIVYREAERGTGL